MAAPWRRRDYPCVHAVIVGSCVLERGCFGSDVNVIGQDRAQARAIRRRYRRAERPSVLCGPLRNRQVDGERLPAAEQRGRHLPSHAIGGQQIQQVFR